MFRYSFSSYYCYSGLVGIQMGKMRRLWKKLIKWLTHDQTNTLWFHVDRSKVYKRWILVICTKFWMEENNFGWQKLSEENPGKAMKEYTLVKITNVLVRLDHVTTNWSLEKGGQLSWERSHAISRPNNR